MRSGDALWMSIFERDNGICQYCNIDMLSRFWLYASSQGQKDQFVRLCGNLSVGVQDAET